MNLNEFKEYFLKVLEENDIKIEDNDIELFYKHMIYILDWNKKINLTGIKDEKEFIVKHFVDSLTINKYIKAEDKIIDIGTGAGFPGIPLKIVNRENKITLIDSVNKKINVLRGIKEELKLNDLEIINIRAEELLKDKEYKEKYDISVTRAVSKLNKITEYMLPFLKKGGKAICMKGPNFKEEINESKDTIEKIGGKIERIDKIIVNNEFERNIIIITKER